MHSMYSYFCMKYGDKFILIFFSIYLGIYSLLKHIVLELINELCITVAIKEVIQR